MSLLDLPTELLFLIFDETFNQKSLKRSIATYAKLSNINSTFSSLLVEEYRDKLKTKGLSYKKNIKVKFPSITFNRFCDDICESPFNISYEKIILQGYYNLNGTGEGTWKDSKQKYHRLWENGTLIKDKVPFCPSFMIINYEGAKKGTININNGGYFTFIEDKKKVILDGSFNVSKYKGNFQNNKLHGLFTDENNPQYKICKNYDNGIITEVKIISSANKNLLVWKPGYIFSQDEEIVFEGIYDRVKPFHVYDMCHHFNWMKFFFLTKEEKLIVDDLLIKHFKNFRVPQIGDFNFSEESLKKLQLSYDSVNI
jgi:hypothetical protein